MSSNSSSNITTGNDKPSSPDLMVLIYVLSSLAALILIATAVLYNLWSKRKRTKKLAQNIKDQKIRKHRKKKNNAAPNEKDSGTGSSNNTLQKKKDDDDGRDVKVRFESSVSAVGTTSQGSNDHVNSNLGSEGNIV